MQQLAKRYDDVIDASQEVATWLKWKDHPVSEEVLESGQIVWVGGIMTQIIIFLIGFTGILFVPFYYGWKSAPIVGAGWILSHTLIHRAFKKWAVKARVAKYAKFQAPLNVDPLYVRARLILASIKDYRLHCDRYRVWFEFQADKNSRSDQELSARYETFLDRMHAVLVKAIDNFQMVAKLAAHQRAYEQEHPHENLAQSTALAELSTQLNQPLEIPPDLGNVDLREALDHEDALAEINDDLEGRELTRQIEAKAAQKALPGKST